MLDPKYIKLKDFCLLNNGLSKEELLVYINEFENKKLLQISNRNNILKFDEFDILTIAIKNYSPDQEYEFE